MKPLSPRDQQTLQRLVRDYGAQAVVGQVKGRKPGRPKKLLLSLEREGLVDTVDWMIDAYVEGGHTAPVSAAFEEARQEHLLEGRPVDIATLKRYYREGCASLRDRDLDIAVEFVGVVKSGEPEERALDSLALSYGLTATIIERRVSRALRSLQQRKGGKK